MLQFLAELLLQFVLEMLAELGLRSLGEPLRFRAPEPWLAAIGYALYGLIAGGVSLWLFPASFIGSMPLRIANLVITPVIAGGLMAVVGMWRRRRHEELIRLDRFAYEFLFALGLGVIRFAFAH